MDRLTAEQRQKVRDLVPGKFYRIATSEKNKQIAIGRFVRVINPTESYAKLQFGKPMFMQILKDPSSFMRNTEYYFNYSIDRIDEITPIEAPEGAPADWEPSISSDGRKYKMLPYLLKEPVNMSSYEVNEPLSAENWAARENAMRKGAPWSKPGATGGGSASYTRKNRRSKRKSRKATRT